MVGVNMEGEKVEASRLAPPVRETGRRLTFYGQLEATRDRAILNLHDLGWTVEEIAKAFRKNPCFVRNRLNPLLTMRAAGLACG